MAVWQYNFELFSNKWFKDINLNEIITDLETIFWKISRENDNSIYLWDDKVDNCLIISYEWKVDSITCRLDLREINQEKIRNIKNIVGKYKLKFLVIEEKLLDWEDFINNLQNSSSAKFVLNPKEFFDKL